MITYGFSVQGKSHIRRGTVCQDYNKIVKIGADWTLGAVADGVGSAVHSDIGSKMATESLCDFCRGNIKSNMSAEELKDILRRGYEYALDEVNRYVAERGGNPGDYDTTLSAALYNGTKVIYGHAGDGGIIVKLCNGKIKPITQRQKGADGTSVRPLRAGGASWDFGICEEGTAAVLLVTDGMLDGVFQSVLLNLPPDRMALARGEFKRDNVYVTAAEFFMNPNSVYLNKRIRDADKFMYRYIVADMREEDQKIFLECVKAGYTKLLGKNKSDEMGRRISKYHYCVWALTKVDDDKSVVCLMNERAAIKPQADSYYYEPEWEKLQEKYNALLYGRQTDRTNRTDDRIDGTDDRIDGTDGRTGSGIRWEDDLRPKKSNNKAKMYILVSAIAVFVLGLTVAGVCLVMPGPKENGDRIVTESSDKPMWQGTEKPSKNKPYNTPALTPEPEEEKPGDDTDNTSEDNDMSEVTKRLDKIKDAAIVFVMNLSKEEFSDDDLQDLKEKLEEYELTDGIKKWFKKNKKNSTSKQSENSESTPTPDPNEIEDENVGQQINDNIQEIINDMKDIFNKADDKETKYIKMIFNGELAMFYQQVINKSKDTGKKNDRKTFENNLQIVFQEDSND